MVKWTEDQLKSEILEIIKETPLWIKEIHRRLIRKGINVSDVTVSKMIRKMELENLVETTQVGTSIQVKLRWENGDNTG